VSCAIEVSTVDQPIAVIIFFVVAYLDARAAGISHAIAIFVLLIRVGHPRAVIHQIADIVAIGIRAEGQGLRIGVITFVLLSDLVERINEGSYLPLDRC
jgi:hypothetical protein